MINPFCCFTNCLRQSHQVLSTEEGENRIPTIPNAALSPPEGVCIEIEGQRCEHTFLMFVSTSKAEIPKCRHLFDEPTVDLSR